MKSVDVVASSLTIGVKIELPRNQVLHVPSTLPDAMRR
jgi:hypothetical protein